MPSDRLTSSVTVCTHQIAFSDKVRNLGFILDYNLTMNQHIIRVCQTAYCELNASVPHSSCNQNASYFVNRLEWLDYSNFPLMDAPNSLIQLMQKVPGLPCVSYSQSTNPTATSLASDLWTDQIQNCLHVLQLSHWLRLPLSLSTTAACRSLRSLSDTHMLKLRRFNRKTHGFRSFSYFDPHILNNLPPRCQTLYYPFPSKSNSRHFSSLSTSSERYT